MYQDDDLSSLYSRSAPSSSLAWTWAVETLTEFEGVDTSLIQLPISASTDFFKSYSSESVRERVALKWLEEWLFDPQWPGPPLPHMPELLRAEDRSIEQVFLSLLFKAPTSDDVVKDGTELFKHDLQQFILKKRASLPSISDDLNLIQEDGEISEEDLLQDHPESENFNEQQNGEEPQLLLQEIPEEDLLQDHPDSEKLNEQQNGKESLMMNQNFVAVVTKWGKNILKENPLGFRRQSEQQTDALKLLLQKISASHVAAREGILQDHRKLNSRHCCNSNCDNANRNEEVQANGSDKIIDPLLCESIATDDEPDILKVPSENNRPLNQDEIDGDKRANGSCLNCGEGGSLLFCSSSNCSNTFHQRCIDSINFDEIGDVYCTLCSFTRSALLYYRAKEKYSQAKRAVANLVVKDSVWQHQQTSHLGFLREANQAGNINCYKNTHAHKEKRKMECNEEKEAQTNSDFENLPRVGETFNNDKEMGEGCKSIIAVRNKIREAKVMPNRNVVFEKGDQPIFSQLHNVPRNMKPLNCIEMPKDTEQVINDLDQEIDNLRYRKAVRFKTTRWPAKRRKPNLQINDEIASTSIGKSTSEKKETCRVTEVNALSGANMRNEARLNNDLSDLHGATHQKDNLEPEIDNLQYRKPVSFETTRWPAKRTKSNLQMNDEIASISIGKTTCEKEETCRVTETHSLSVANMRNDLSAIHDQTHQKNDLEQEIDNLQHKKAVSFETTRWPAGRRKSNLQMNDEITSISIGKSTCEKEETCRVTEPHALSGANMRNKASLNNDLSEHDQTHQKQSTCINGHDFQNPRVEVVVDPLTREEDSTRIGLHTAVPIHQPHLSTKSNIGEPYFCSEGNEQNKNNDKQWNKRKKKYWTPEEEQALKDEVEKVSLNNGNVPWSKIWESIRHVFRENRHPHDLKDKWRNIMIKEARERQKG